MKMFRAILKQGVLLAPMFLAASVSQADTILTLTDGTTAFTVNTSSSAGMFSWTLNGGPNLMPQQWFWVRTGSSFVTQSALQSIDSLSAPNVEIYDPANFPDFAEFQYASAALSADVSLDAVDGNPAGLSQQVQFTNLSASQIALTVFQYIHFQLSSGSDSASASGNGVTQSGSLGSSQVEVIPFDSRYTGYQLGDASALLAGLNNPATSSTFNVNNAASATGDVGILIEWQTLLAPNGQLTLSNGENLSPTPEPASVMLIGIGIAALCGRRNMKRHDA